MTSRGVAETKSLIQNLEEQLERLVAQLADLEEAKGDLSPEEYEETRHDTLDQLREFGNSLAKLKGGDLSLVDRVNALQLAVQAAVSSAFATPETIKLFTRKHEPSQIRARIAELDRDAKLGKTAADSANREKAELLVLLKRSGEELTPSELAFLSEHASSELRAFVNVDENAETVASDKVMKLAGSKS